MLLVIACGSAVVALRAVAEPPPVSHKPVAPVRASFDATKIARNAVAQQDRANAAQADAVQSAGWSLVETAPPDERVVALDPSLLTDREAELRVQLASTVPLPTAIPNLIAIAKSGARTETRTAAVDALARVGDPLSQRALLALLGNGGLAADDPARLVVAARIHPTALDDPFATEVAQVLDAGTLTTAETQQLAFTLALIGLRDGMTLPPATLAALSPSTRQLLDQMTALAKSAHR